MDSALLDRVLDLAVNIQQIPAPPFKEEERARFVHEQFQAEELCDVTQDDLGNVQGRLPGKGGSRPLVVSAHLDTVFPASTQLGMSRRHDQIAGPGIGDNSLGVAGLLGLLWIIRQRGIVLPGDLWLVANVGEEGLGNLRGMRAIVDRFGSQVLAYLILEGMALGQIYHRGLGVKRYRISVRTPGGHSWVDYGHPSAVHELAAIITQLTALPVPRKPRSSLNVGVISGGISINTIAAEAFLELDLRSEGEKALDELTRRIEALVRAANRQKVEVTLQVIGQRPAGKISSLHPLVRLAKRSLEAQGIHPNLAIGSTDANVPLSLGLPAICLGLTSGGGAHTTDEFINTAPVSSGLEQVAQVVQGAFRELG